MNSLIIYLIQSAFGLGTLYIIYWIFLRRDTFFGLNRVYLILSVFASLVFPLMKIPFSTGEEQLYMIFLEPVIITQEGIKESVIQNLNATQLLLAVYFAGAASVFVRFLFRLIQIGVLISRNRISMQSGIKVVNVPSGFTPFSFFNMLFISNDISDKEQLNKIVAHEKVHMQQKHSADIMLLELISVIQWFNPFIWLYRSAVKNVHEFQADNGVLISGYNKRDYQELLLNQSFGAQLNTLSNNFNHSLIKKRFIMMTKTKTKKAALLKLLFVVPTAMILTLFFSISVTNKVVAQVDKSTKQVQQEQESTKSLSDENQKKKKETPVKSKEIKDAYVVPEDMPQFPGGDEARIKYMVDNIKYPENARKNGIYGRVFITFVVERDGSITGVEMLRGFDKECDAEAMRVIKMMPNWTPGMVNGQPVRTVFNMPISFNLDGKGEKEVKTNEVKDPPPPPKK